MPLPDDWSFPRLGDLVAGVADLETEGIARATVRMPVELDLSVADDGSVAALDGSTPTQYTATTIMPVFHTLQLTIERRSLDG